MMAFNQEKRISPWATVYALTSVSDTEYFAIFYFEISTSCTVFSVFESSNLVNLVSELEMTGEHTMFGNEKLPFLGRIRLTCKEPQIACKLACVP